jgi:hypothetical protein
MCKVVIVYVSSRHPHASWNYGNGAATKDALAVATKLSHGSGYTESKDPHHTALRAKAHNLEAL